MLRKHVAKFLVGVMTLTSVMSPLGMTASNLALAEEVEQGKVDYIANLDFTPETLDLTDDKYVDWMHFGIPGDSSAVDRKDTDNPILTEPEFSPRNLVTDFSTAMTFTHTEEAPEVSTAPSSAPEVSTVPSSTPEVSAAPSSSAPEVSIAPSSAPEVSTAPSMAPDGVKTTTLIEGSHNAIHTGSDNHRYSIDVPASDKEYVLKIYTGAWNANSYIEVSDDTDAKPTVLHFKAGGTAETRCVSVRFHAEGENAQLHVKAYKKDGSGNISLAAYTLEEAKESKLNCTTEFNGVPETLDISALSYDWKTFGNNPSVVSKAGIETSMIEAPVSLAEGFMTGNDYKTKISWSDGNEAATGSESRQFLYSWSGIKQTINVQPGKWDIHIYNGGWRSLSRIQVLDANGDLIPGSCYQLASRSSGSNYGDLVIHVETEEATTLNAFFLATVNEQNEDLGNTGIAAISIIKSTNMTALNEAIVEAEKVDQSKYTEETVSVFAQALADAKTVAANDESSQETIDNALKVLNDAKAALVKIIFPDVDYTATLEKTPATLDLTDSKLVDWVYVGLDGDKDSVVRKETETPKLSAPVVAGGSYLNPVTDYSMATTLDAERTGKLNAIATDGNFVITAPADQTLRELKIYTGAWNADSDITIYDDTDREVTTLTYKGTGDSADTRFVTVRYSCDKPANIHVRIKKVGGSGNVSLSAYTLSEIGKSSIKATVSMNDLPDSINLTTDAYDWRAFGFAGADVDANKARVRKSAIGAATPLAGNLQQGNDYRTPLTWTDGEDPATCEGTKNFTYCFEGQKFGLTAYPGVMDYEIYLSSWRGKGMIQVVDEEGALVGSTMLDGRTGSSIYGLMKLHVETKEQKKLTVYINPGRCGTDGFKGNLGLAAVKAIYTVNLTELSSKIKSAEEINAADYTEASVTVLNKAVTDAKAVLAKDEVTKEEVAAAAKAIDDAIAGLESVTPPAPVVDKTALTTAVENAKAIEAEKYTDDSYKVLTDALAAATAVAEKTDATQEEVDAQVAAIDAAVKALVLKEDASTPAKVDVTSVTISGKANVSLVVGKTATLKATVAPADATDKKITWATSDAKVATVANGKVTAKAAGTATITATADGKTAKVVVTVLPKAISKWSVSKKGKKVTIKVTKVNKSYSTLIQYRKAGAKKFTKLTLTSKGSYAKKLKKGKYEFKVASYVKVKGKVYQSAFSKVKKVTVK
ncbi:MAG: FIVAR domain-containing protein [Lachnospiraceae bacterium]|nr:FIVAR domain-containing protein [Lachnospiraceae bacterium]